MNRRTRTETDSMGDMQVPEDALWGAQTQRAVLNFPLSGLPMPAGFIRALGLVKKVSAQVNGQLQLLDAERSAAIAQAAGQIAGGEYSDQFPVDVFQTGSGTSTNMNANEVIARLATQQSGQEIHANDHVNLGQSSNDVIPTTLQVSAVLACERKLLPALRHLEETLAIKSEELEEVVKTGRTHLMDAMPVTFGQELNGWAEQLRNGQKRIRNALKRMRRLPMGGTAVGTGINAHPDFRHYFVAELTRQSGYRFKCADSCFEGISSEDAALELSGQLKTVAASLIKICNDLRLMNSGPLAGIGEIELPALQPGSSIMPGKVNPVMPEAVAMICAQVTGNDATINVAAQSGLFQLNVMMPVVALNLLQSIQLLGNGSSQLADRAIRDFRVKQSRIDQALSRNPILVTALNPIIGYELGAKIAKRAYAEGRPVREIALEMTDLDENQLDELLDPLALTRGGIQEG